VRMATKATLVALWCRLFVVVVGIAFNSRVQGSVTRVAPR